jgi:adenylate cyclase
MSPQPRPWHIPGFDPDLEARYQADTTARIMPLGRMAAMAGTVIFIALIAWDHHVDPTSLDRTIPIRIVMSALFAVAFVATFTERGRRSVAPYMSLHLVVAVGYPVLLSRIEGGFVVGVPGMVLVMIVVPILSTRWWHAAIALGMLTVIPNVIMVAAGATRFEIVNADYFLASGAVVAAFLTYLIAADRRRAFASQVALEAEERRSNDLLLNILPAGIVERLKDTARSTSDAFADATVIFADIAGFTDYAETIDAAHLVEFLNALFSAFDDVVARHGIEKIKTIGDAYMAVAGVPAPVPDHAEVAVEAAREMFEAFSRVCGERDLDLHLRIGMHSGPLVGGVIGKRKFSYDVWGDTVNVASRMETTGEPDRIQVSASTAGLLDGRYDLEPRGAVALKHHSPIGAFLVGARRAEAPRGRVHGSG